MFIRSFKTSRAELAVILAGLICFILTLCYILFAGASGGVRRTSSGGGTQTQTIDFLTDARTAEDRLKFLEQFGWTVDADPLDVREVVIPAEFDENYLSYAEMQRSLGFDLEEYKGRSVKKWVYGVTNYPGRPANVRATLLICDGRVIGGDITGAGNHRFTHSLLLTKQDAE